MRSTKIWLLYDGRYIYDKERAVCFEMCESIEEANRNKNNYGNDTVIVEAITKGRQIINTKIIE